MKIKLFKVPQGSPDDLSALAELIQNQSLDPTKIVAILGKTEGNGCVNDFTRGFAVQTLKTYLKALYSQAGLDPASADSIVYVMSGGTEGVLSPHLTVFTREAVPVEQPRHWGLVLGVRHTPNFLPQQIGTLAMVDAVAKGVQAAIAEAGLAKADVHFVQIKCPLVMASEVGALAQSSYQSMAYSRGAAALGVAIALGEVDRDRLTQADICANYDLYSAVASTSAGVELRNCEILVLGNAAHSASNYVIHHATMRHALDVEAVQQAIAQTGQGRSHIVNVFAKAEADPSGLILGRRHTMLDDSDINHTRMARAVVGAVIASVVQDPMVYVSGGSEHQGPAGGGPVAAIAKISETAT
ncbi:MAG TPA: ring-opening amidohydrolase [Coleofasciculaceae cyanobacterium]|jgi:cyanuric acid amidohydrolase